MNNMTKLKDHLKNNVLDEDVSLNAYVVLLLERESSRNKIIKALQEVAVIGIDYKAIGNGRPN